MVERDNDLTEGASDPQIDRVLAEPTQPCNDMCAVLGAFERLGCDRTQLLAAAGLSAADLTDPDARFPYRLTRAIFKAALAERHIPNLGLRLALHVPMGAYEVVDYLVTSSDVVGEGLARLARYFRLISELIEIVIHDRQDPVRVELVGPTGPIPAFGVEFTVALTLQNLRQETDRPFRAQAISFRHEPDDKSEFENIFGCRVATSGAWDGFAISRETFEQPLRRRDPRLKAVLERHASERIARIPVVGGPDLDVKRVLAERVLHGDVEIESVARRLGTTSRTLQRRLREMGASYQALLDQARADAARQYLAASNLSACEVGYMLGYSEASAFHRAFRRWTGETPEGYRKRMSCAKSEPNPS